MKNVGLEVSARRSTSHMPPAWTFFRLMRLMSLPSIWALSGSQRQRGAAQGDESARRYDAPPCGASAPPLLSFVRPATASRHVWRGAVDHRHMGQSARTGPRLSLRRKGPGSRPVRDGRIKPVSSWW